MLSASLWQFVLFASSVLAIATTPTRTLHAESRSNNGPLTDFVKTENGQFVVNGKPITLIGTNAYWLSILNADEDVDNVFGNLSALGVNVVRTWGFNDVESIPDNGTWFQHIKADGTIEINNGTNGFPKLDKVVQAAENHGIYLILALTNNWNPHSSDLVARDGGSSNSNPPPRNTLSNDYGGMDVFVRQLGKVKEHDQFYSNQSLIATFKKSVTHVVSRYVQSPAILGWEVANDARCHSSLPAGADCNTNVVTLWHQTVAQHVQTVDPNHLVSSGNGGFFCPDCPKLFPQVTPPPPPPPLASPVPGKRRRAIPEPLTKLQLLKERKQMLKKKRALQKRSGESAEGIRIRGRWVASRAPPDNGLGSSFDGSQGVDSEDILNIPEIGFGSFQLFPDQNAYGFDDPSLPPFENMVQIGLNWINFQADSSRRTGKPMSLNGFGLVTQRNAPSFVPFNTTASPFRDTPVTSDSFGVTETQRDDAYSQWLGAGLSGGLHSMMQYQWGQSGMTAITGTTISPIQSESGQSPISGSTSGQTPNDGYSIQGVGEEGAQAVIHEAALRT